MQTDFDAAAEIAEIAVELTNQQIDPEVHNEPVLAASDNGLSWPLIPLPEDWYAFF
jgi:hypothetical protein